jgi:cell division protein FtsQ
VTAVTGLRRLPIDPRLRARRAAVKRAVGRRRLRWLLVAVTAVAAVLVAAAVVWSPLLAVQRIDVRGAGAEHDAVLRAAGVHAGDPLLFVHAGAAAAAIERLPEVASARVERAFPTTVTISVTLRTPVAWASLGPGRFAVIDAHGTVMAVDPTAPLDLPGLAGLSRVPSLGGHVSAPAAAMAAALGPDLRSRVTTVVATPQGLLGLVYQGPQLRFGDDTHLADKAEAADAVLRALVYPATYIDVSVPTAPVEG